MEGRGLSPIATVARVAPSRSSVATLLGGPVLVLGAVLAADRFGGTVMLGALVALLLFGVLVLGFVAAPHVSVAAVIPTFAFLPAIKVLYIPWIGPLKEFVIAAAAVALGILLVRRAVLRTSFPDGIVLVAVVGLAALYLLNLGSGYEEGSFGAAWLHTLRLVYGPLVLLLLGLTLADPERTLRWAAASLVATASAVGVYGLYQQVLGGWGLVDMGYAWNVQVRTYRGWLRSFGTMDDSFAYAAFLLFALAVLLLWMRATPRLLIPIALVSAGLAVSFVRTALPVAIALAGLAVARRHVTTGISLVTASAVAAGAFFFIEASAVETRVVQAAPSTYLTLNGRTDIWGEALGGPSQWPLGRGVGEVGSGAARAAFGLYRSQEDAAENFRSYAVDSGYLQTIADVGVVGLALLLLLLGRLLQLSRLAIREGRRAGWIALGLLTVLLLDNLTRGSFTGFPTAFLGLLLIGIALAAAARPEGPEERAAAPRAGAMPP